VSDDAPFAELPDAVTFDRPEVAASLLFASDLVETAQVEESDRAIVRAAIRLVTSKLWPELGDLLEEEDEG